MNNHLTYRYDLQLLRGASVLLVCFYHLDIPGFQNGFLGVDIFFVLSGFLMAQLANKATPFEFYARRLKRLLPAYFIVVLATSLIAIILTLPVDANQRLQRIFYDLVGLSNFAFWAENSYFSSTAFKPLLNFWSLAVELQFYLVAPFLLPFLQKRKFVLILMIFSSLLLSMAVQTISPKTSFFMLPTRLWEFLLGAYSAWIVLEHGQRTTNKPVLLLSVVCLISVILLYPISNDSLSILTGHPGVAALFVAVSSSVIVAIRADRIFSLRSRLSRILISLGDYSYSIYLVHFPIIVLVNYHEFGGTRLGYGSISDLVTIVALTICSSFFLYHYVEKIRYSNRAFLGIFTLILLSGGLGIFGGNLSKLSYSSSEILVFNAWEDRATYRCGKLARIFNPTSNVCLIGDDLGGERVLLLGNSHADSIKIAFQTSMEERGITTYFYTANTPLMSHSENEEKIRGEMLRNRISSVVVHYSSGFYMDDTNTARLKAFVELIRDSEISIFYIAPVPVYDYHIPKMMWQSLRDPNAEFTLTDYDRYKIDTEGFENFVEENGIDRESIWYTHSVFCPHSRCLYQEDGVPYYYDEGHLTLTGALQLRPLFNEIAVRLSHH